MSEYVTKEAFKEALNQNFKIYFDARRATDAILTEVRVIRELPRQETFSVVFLAPTTAPLQQSLFEVEHRELGLFDLFLMPVSKDENGVRFETILRRELSQCASGIY